jgi:hypothetical protein
VLTSSSSKRFRRHREAFRHQIRRSMTLSTWLTARSASLFVSPIVVKNNVQSPLKPGLATPMPDSNSFRHQRSGRSILRLLAHWSEPWPPHFAIQ